MKKIIKIALVTCSFLITQAAFALDPIYTGFFSDQAIKGYDTVAYFTQSKAVKGSEEFKTQYKQATWLFSSQEHLDLFIAEPDKYAPQYGGYCAYAVAKNSTASIKPELFTVVNDKLYLNYSKKVNENWLDNQDEFIESANKNWPQLLAK